MAEFPALLERLRRLRGIERSFTDYHGRTRELSLDSLRRLLAALGHAVDDDAALEREAASLDEREWVRVLPPVLVLREQRRVEFTVLAPLLPLIRWRVETEQGPVFSGEFEPWRLPVVGERGIRELWYVRLALELPQLPMGYHQLLLEKADGSPLDSSRLIIAPLRCHEPAALRQGARPWGLAIQLYTLRSGRNWGIGDFTDLAGFAESAARLGADLIGVNPLHALFPADPALCGPYSPSSRYFLNVLYIDPEAIPEFSSSLAVQRLTGTPEFQARLEQLRAAPFVDYAGVGECKLEVLRLVYAEFTAHASGERSFEFLRFLQQHGEALERFSMFHALQVRLGSAGIAGGWTGWPRHYRDCGAAAASAFREAAAEDIEFHGWLQWIAAMQLEAAEQAARAAGMALSLYRDLAVGPNGGGAETWAGPEAYVQAATIGAPPDPLAPQGQDWGIPPFHPDRLRELAYEPFVRLLRANMGEGGALRIDHVMALCRLWWVPRGCPSSAGGYVRYRLDELMAIVALESQRQHCLVIGEDLGTVPPEVDAAMADHGLYSYRVLFFERDEQGRFRRPAEYPPEALVAVSTHDLPPLASYWAGTDIDLRERLGLYPEQGQAALEQAARARDRVALLDALAAEGLVPPTRRESDGTTGSLDTDLARAIQRFLARSPSRVLVLQPEDWLGVDTPVNVPGTHGEYPNWGRKLTAEWPEFMAREDVRGLAESINLERRGNRKSYAE